MWKYSIVSSYLSIFPSPSSPPLSHTHTHTHRLQKFVDSIASNFREMAPDLMTNEFGRDSVKLHATVMNVKFVDHDVKSRETDSRNAKKCKINAINVFKVNISKLDKHKITSAVNTTPHTHIQRFKTLLRFLKTPHIKSLQF